MTSFGIGKSALLFVPVMLDYSFPCMVKLVNYNVGCETSFPVSVVFTPPTLPSKQIALAEAERK